MSFYGSVYYQLVDAFNKIIINNTGFSQYEGPNSIQTGLNINAQGRKDQLILDSGNKWIQFAVNNSDNEIKIYHKVVNSNSVPGSGRFGPPKDNDKIDQYTSKTIIPGQPFLGHEIEVDSAGHISKIDTYAYTIPQSETDQSIEKLEELVGEKSKWSNLGDSTLCESIENNVTQINTINDYINFIKQVYGIPEDTQYFFDDNSTENGKYKLFPKYFGSINNIITKWQSILNSNAIVRSYITSNREFDDYYTESNGTLIIKDISSALCIAAIAVNALDNNIADTSGAASTLAHSAIEALGKNKTNGSTYFNADNTVARTLGMDGDICRFNASNTVWDKIEECTNAVSNYTEDAEEFKIKVNNLENSIEEFKTESANKFDEVDNTIGLQFNKDNSIAAVLGIDPESEDEQCYFNATNTVMSVIKQLQDRIETLENQLNESQPPEEETIE